MITSDIQFQIDCVSKRLVDMLMNRYGWDMKNAIDALYTSKTFELLSDPQCGLYYESPVYVFSFLQSEIETGKLT